MPAGLEVDFKEIPVRLVRRKRLKKQRLFFKSIDHMKFALSESG